MIRCIVFDLDGTLADTTGDLACSMNHVLRIFGKPEKSLPVLTSYIGDGLDIYLTKSFDSDDPDLIAKAKPLYREYYAAHLTEHTFLYPGVLETLGRIRDLGILSFVLSNKADEFVGPLLKALGISEYFTAAYGQYRFKEIKPHPEGLRFILKEFGFGPDEALMVGDNHTDIVTAANAGVRSVFCSFGIGTAGACVPDHTIRAFPELLGLL